MEDEIGRAGLYLQPAFALVSCSTYSSTLKMDVTCSCEMSVYFQRTTSRYILEARTLFSLIVLYLRLRKTEKQA
jgi:hypothetical protein